MIGDAWGAEQPSRKIKSRKDRKQKKYIGMITVNFQGLVSRIEDSYILHNMQRNIVMMTL